MKNSIELEMTTIFDEKNLQRVSCFGKEEYTFQNCTNKPLSCLIVDKTNKPKLHKFFGKFRDKRKVYCAIHVEDKKIYAYFCGNEKKDDIVKILEKFSKEYEHELILTQQEKESLPIICFRDTNEALWLTNIIRLWWNKLPLIEY